MAFITQYLRILAIAAHVAEVGCSTLNGQSLLLS
jgi:hypothetical protein